MSGLSLQRREIERRHDGGALPRAGEGWGGGARQARWWIGTPPPTRRALARNCAAKRVDLPQAGGVKRGVADRSI
jgi:hypothetical protein